MTFTEDQYRMEDNGLDTNCLIWTKGTDSNGYPQVWHEGRNRGAHRVAFEIANGPLPAGARLTPICGNKTCIQAAHWESSKTVAQAPTGARPEVVADLTSTPSWEQVVADATRQDPDPPSPISGSDDAPSATCRTAVAPSEAPLAAQVAAVLGDTIGRAIAKSEQVQLILKTHVLDDVQTRARLEGIPTDVDVEAALAQPIEDLIAASPGADYACDGALEIAGVLGPQIAAAVEQALRAASRPSSL